MSIVNGPTTPNMYPKAYSSGTYPLYNKTPSGLLTRVEPLLTPTLFRSRFLLGLERLFALANFHPTDENLLDWITIGINEAEVLLDCLIYAERKFHSMPLDINLSRNWMFTQLPAGPVLELYNFALAAADEQSIFQIPAVWVDMSQAAKSIITVIPLMSAASNQSISTSTSSPYGWPFYQRLWGFNWIPAFLQFDYLAGMCKDRGETPVICNELIGIIVMLRILNMLLLLFPYTSQSISADGISQSSSLSVAFITARIEFMTARRDELVGKIRMVFSRKIYLSNI